MLQTKINFRSKDNNSFDLSLLEIINKFKESAYVVLFLHDNDLKLEFILRIFLSTLGTHNISDPSIDKIMTEIAKQHENKMITEPMIVNPDNFILNSLK